MKKLAILYLFFIWFDGQAQNLVPNFSFEQYDTCPSMQDQVQYSTGWSKYSDIPSTPDYYNACASSGGLGIPQSFFFYQPDHRNCGAYVGLVTKTNNSNEREDVGIPLSAPMIVGQKYFLSFYTVMGGTSDGTFYYESPSNNIGLRLSTVAYNPSNPAPIDNFAHLRSVAIINDTLNWIRISGSMIADSAYSYVILGNFYDDANTDTVTLNCGTCLNNYSYCLIDDVCISTDSLLANGGVDALPCTVSVPEIVNGAEISLYPNPTKDMVTVSFKNSQNDEIILIDILGKTYYSEKINNRSFVMVNLTDYPSGMYFLKITSIEGKQTISKKIIKL